MGGGGGYMGRNLGEGHSAPMRSPVSYALCQNDKWKHKISNSGSRVEYVHDYPS